MQKYDFPKLYIPIVRSSNETDRLIDLFIDKTLFKMNLIELRASEHITQKELSEISGLSTTTISAMESTDPSNPTLNSIVRYIDALGYELALRKKK